MTKSSSMLEDLEKAFLRFKEVLLLEPTDVNQDATIQRFEFTFELSWKLMQAILQENRIESYGVKTVFREAARMDLISDPILWFDFLEARNNMSHTYNEEEARKIYLKLKDFTPLVENLVEKAKSSV